MAAIGLHLSSVTYSLKYDTDGHISLPVARFLMGNHKPNAVGDLLVEAGLFAPAEPDGWWIVDFSHYIEPDRVKLPGWMRQQVIERDGYICGLCGGDVEPMDVHIDHIWPVARGGGNSFDNLQVAHSSCNVRKGASVQ